MPKHLSAAGLLLLALTSWPSSQGRRFPERAAADCSNLVINQEWDVGIDCTLQFVVDHEAHGWVISLTFDSPLSSLDCWQATVSTTDSLTFTLTNLAWDGDFTPGSKLDLHIQSHFASGTRPHLVAAHMDGQDICEGGGGEASSSTAPPSSTTAAGSTTAAATTEVPDDGKDCSHVVTVMDTDAAQHTTDLAIHLTPATDIQSWVVDLTFRTAVDSVQSPMADVTGSGTAWRLVNKSWDGGINAGETLELMVSVRHMAAATCPPVVGVSFSGTEMCEGEKDC